MSLAVVCKVLQNKNLNCMWSFVNRA